jgi:hypothetical protein
MRWLNQLFAPRLRTNYLRQQGVGVRERVRYADEAKERLAERDRMEALMAIREHEKRLQRARGYERIMPLLDDIGYQGHTSTLADTLAHPNAPEGPGRNVYHE